MTARSLLRPLLALTFSTALFACTEEDGHGHDEGGCDDARADAILALTPDEGNGAVVYASSCGNSGCHGADGISGPAPDLTAAIPQHSSDELACVLLSGTGNMPSQASMSDQELADVIAYVESTFQ